MTFTSMALREFPGAGDAPGDLRLLTAADISYALRKWQQCQHHYAH